MKTYSNAFLLLILCGISKRSNFVWTQICLNTLSLGVLLQLPEMTKMDPKEGEHPLLHLALQNSGMLVGSAIMLTIALVEDDIHRAFN